MNETPTAEQLLADVTWLKRLAITLAGNEIDADDLVQESWIAAWSRKPDANRSLRPWLSKVIRDVAGMRKRSERRREAREHAADLDRVTTPPDVLLDQVRLHRLLAELVLELDDPFRSTIVARFVEDRTAAAIARAQGVPESTVRSRLREGLARLRAGLDSARGERKAWAPAVLVFAKGTVHVAKPTKSIIAIIALLALLLGGVAILLVRRSASSNARLRDDVAALPFASRRLGSGAGESDRRVPSWFGQRGARWRRIAGRVTFEGKPVPGAAVSVHSKLTGTGEIAPPRRRTDADGRFDFGTLPPATYNIVAAQDGRTAAVARVALDDPTSKPPPDQLELQLLACVGSVQGTIVDAAGTPIAHAHVLRDQLVGVDADDRGSYRICTPREQSISLAYGADGYGTVVMVLDVRGELRRDVVLVPEAMLTVRALRADSGVPVEDAYVNVWPAIWSNKDHAAPGSGLTDKDGRAHVATLLPGEYTVIAFDADGVTAGPTRVSVVVGPNPEVTVRLEAQARIRGRVVHNGAPVAGAEVFASEVPPPGRTLSVHSQEDGSFVLGDVPVGELAVFAAPYRVVSPTRFRAAEPKNYDVEIEVAPLGSLSGRVTRLGAPVADVEVCCVRDVRGLGETVRTDASGHYEFRGVLPGTYDVAASSSDAFVRPQKATLVDREDKTLDLELDLAATIDGVVLDQDGKPVVGVHVRWLDEKSGDRGVCATDAQGHYHCAAMSGGGRYRAAVFPTDAMQRAFATSDRNSYPVVDLANGTSTASNARIAIAYQQLSIGGTVVDDSGSPVVDARVEAQPSESSTVPPFSPWLRLPTTFTDESGAFVLGGVASGNYSVHAHAAEGGDGVLPSVIAGTTNATVTIVRPASIRATLAGFSSSPTLTARIVGPLTDSARHWYGTGDENSASITGLAPGRYIVDAQTQAEGDAQLVDLHSGETVTVALTAHGRAAIDGAVLDFRTHQPLPGARCEAFMASGGEIGVASWDIAMSASSDSTGSVTLDPAPAGTVDVVCWMASNRWSRPSVRVALSAGTRTSVRLWSVEALQDTPGTTGIVLDAVSPTARVLEVAPDSSAARAGMQAGDVIVAVNGVAVDELDGGGVSNLIDSLPVGSEVAVTLSRGAVRSTLSMAIEAK